MSLHLSRERELILWTSFRAFRTIFFASTCRYVCCVWKFLLDNFENFLDIDFFSFVQYRSNVSKRKLQCAGVCDKFQASMIDRMRNVFLITCKFSWFDSNHDTMTWFSSEIHLARNIHLHSTKHCVKRCNICFVIFNPLFSCYIIFASEILNYICS